jgi:hypothetical protein
MCGHALLKCEKPRLRSVRRYILPAWDQGSWRDLCYVNGHTDSAYIRQSTGDLTGGKTEETMGMWVAVTGAVMAGFCLGVLYTCLLHIAKRENAEAESFVGTAHPARMGK